MRLSELIRGHRRREPRERQSQRRTARLRPSVILAAAARAGYRDWRRVLAVAIPVSLLSAAAEMLVDHYVDPADSVLSLTAALSATGISLVGTVLLSCLVGQLISAAERGKAAMTLPQVARSLSWGRLIAADLLVSLAVLIGLVLLVIPGLVILTLFAVVGPVIETEHRKIFAAMRRSVRLTRAHPWTALLVATVPLALAAEVEALAPEPHHAGEIAEFLILRGVAEGIVEA
ncbi:MAG TPA: YciC family protein, partial [Trebonia sp.]|nr:YciC family protein [Trebonia sp.]